MLFINDIVEYTDYSEPFILDCPAPKYIVNMYINAIYRGIVNIHDIEPCDLNHFLRFIDRYPTKIMSIDRLEDMLVQYFQKNDLYFGTDYFDNELKDIINRYELKFLYLHAHNKKMVK